MSTLPKSDLSRNADDSLAALFEADIEHDRGEAAQSHLQAGRPIHYVEETTPEGHVIREHPNGDRELLQIDADGVTNFVSAV
jgi:hypothetical protein